MKTLHLLITLLLISIGGNLFAQDLSIDYRPFLSKKYYEGSQNISKREFKEVMKTNPIAYQQYKLGRNLDIASYIIGIPAVTVLAYSSSTRRTNKEKPNKTIRITSGVCYGGAFVLSIIGQRKIKRSVETYNTSERIGWNLSLNENGVGIALQF